jgi:hypothetical protein
MGAKENYEARKAAEKAKREARKNRRWWFNQSVPIDRFTGWLVTWTALLFIATVINAGVLWKTDNTLHDTLLETKKSADAAEDSANAARAAVELSDRTAERQLRAYINIEKIDLTWNKGSASAEIGLRNAGQTPASNMIFRGLIATNEDVSQTGKLPAYFGDGPANFIIGDEDTSKVTRILGQGREESFNVISNTPYQKQSFKLKPKFPVRLFVIGAVYYNDIFGKPRHTRFCVYYVSFGTRGYCTEHNDAN